MNDSGSTTLANLLSELAPNDANIFLGELELRAAQVRTESGELDQAAQLLEQATAHLPPARSQDLARAWLALTRAMSRMTHSETADDVEAALARAVELDPRIGSPALARHLQGRNRPAEAVQQWRKAIECAPDEASHYLNLAQFFERTGDPQQALTTYLSAVEAAPSLSTWLLVAERLNRLVPQLPKARPDQAVRIALLGNATMDHLKSYLSVECLLAGLRPEIYQAGFDQYSQEIFDPNSGLYAFAPDVVICAIHASRIIPGLHDLVLESSIAERRTDIAAGVSSIRGLLDTLTQRTSAIVLLHNMVTPQHPVLGILDLRDEFGQAASFAEINVQLAELVRTRYQSVYLVDEDRVQAEVGKSNSTDPRTWFTARMGWSEQLLSRLAREHMRFVRAYRGRVRKCVVVDLDNTLWGGVIGEDGMAGIKLGSEAPGNAYVAFQRELERLWKRGVLLAVCSKNNPEDAFKVLDHHPDMVLRRSHFAACRINWQPKVFNIRDIARELNIGLDSLVFLDDNPLERAKVRAELPEVLTPDLPVDAAQYRSSFLALRVFDTLALTEEDRMRNRFYAAQQERAAFQEGVRAGGSLETYLSELQIVADLEPATAINLPRIAQLMAKTNQFNMTTRRYSNSELLERLERGWKVIAARVSDRFGDNGLTGVIIVDPTDNTWEIDSLLLSCRVMGRQVETALLAYVAGLARAWGATRLSGSFVPTSKNAPAEACYREHGFTLFSEDASGSRQWVLDITGELPSSPEWMTVHVTDGLANADKQPALAAV